MYGWSTIRPTEPPGHLHSLLPVLQASLDLDIGRHFCMQPLPHVINPLRIPLLCPQYSRSLFIKIIIYNTDCRNYMCEGVMTSKNNLIMCGGV